MNNEYRKDKCYIKQRLGYVSSVDYILELENEIDNLQQEIDEIEKFFKYNYDTEVKPLNDRKISVWTICLDKLKELKGGDE